MEAYFSGKIPLAYQGIYYSIQAEHGSQRGVLIHDLYFLDEDAQVGWWDRHREKRWLQKVLQGAENVFVYTEYTQKSILHRFPATSAQIQLLPHVVDELLVPTDEDARDVVRYQFTLGDAYFLCTAPIHEAAHIIPLLKGFSLFKKRTNSNMKLVLTGVRGSFSSSILLAVDNYKYRNDLVFLDGLSPSDQKDLLCSAYALVHPCRWERFGMPIINALKAGVAVLTAEESAMSEMAGMAGMYFNEKDGGAIGERLIRIYNDEQMRSEMIGTGLLRFR